MKRKSAIIQGSLFEDDYLVRTPGNIARDPDYALTELVANAWDAGATNVQIPPTPPPLRARNECIFANAVEQSSEY